MMDWGIVFMFETFNEVLIGDTDTWVLRIGETGFTFSYLFIITPVVGFLITEVFKEVCLIWEFCLICEVCTIWGIIILLATREGLIA